MASLSEAGAMLSSEATTVSILFSQLIFDSY